MRSVRLYLDILWLDLYARSQYRADFLIGLCAALLQHSVTLATLWLIFQQVPALGGWSAAQAAVLYGLFAMAMGLVNLLGAGLRDLPGLVEAGELDGLLILPVHPYVQLLPRFNPNAVGDLAVGAVVIALSGGVVWSLPVVLYGLLAVVCGAAILLGMLTAVYALSFWVRQPGVTNGVEQLTELARYPAGIYPRWVQVLITWIFPVAFASFYPASVLTGVGAVPLWMGLLAVPMAGAALAAGAAMWRFGLSKYEGTGS
jgi:ABC-2 type transport system permease protein